MHGGYSEGARHIGAFDGNRLVGTCMVFPAAFAGRLAARGWQLRSMAVEPDCQGVGIGAVVLRAAVAQVARGGGELLWCDARLTAARFYARHGLVEDGEPFVQAETGLPHVRMWRWLDGVRGSEPFDQVNSST